MSQDRMNKFECPNCKEPLGLEDVDWLQRVINRAGSLGSFVLQEPPRELSCGHEATAEAAQLQSGSGVWLVPR